MATVVNMFPDRRSDIIGRGLGAGIGKHLDEKKKREALEAQRLAIQNVLLAPEGSLDDASALNNLLAADVDPDDAQAIIGTRRKDFERKRTTEGRQQFFRALNEGSSFEEAFTRVSETGFLTQDLMQDLSQGGFGAGINKVQLFDPSTKTTREIFLDKGLQSTDENVQAAAPKLFEQGFRPAIPVREPAAGEKKLTQKDKDVQAFVETLGKQDDPDALARARVFLPQQERRIKEIDMFFADRREIDEFTGEPRAFFEGGLSLDKALTAKRLLAPEFMENKEHATPSAAMDRVIETASDLVDKLDHIPGNTLEEKMKRAKKRNWTKSEIQSAMARTGKLASVPKGSGGKTVQQLIDEIWAE